MALKDEKILNGTQNEGNANQSTLRCQFLLSDWVTKLGNQLCWQGCSKSAFSALLSARQNHHRGSLAILKK